MKHLAFLRILLIAIMVVFCGFEQSLLAQSAVTPQQASEPAYTLYFPGKRQPDGTFSPARFYPIYRTPKGTYLENRLYVKMRQYVPIGKNGASLQSSAVMNILQRYGVRAIAPAIPKLNGNLQSYDPEGLGNVYSVRLEGNADVYDVCKELVQSPDVEYAEPVYLMQLHNDSTARRFTPNDPLFSRQYEWQRIDAERAWGVTTGSASVVIGIIDSGVDYEHEDLASKIWTNPGESGRDANGRDKRTNGIDDDNNGRIDDFRGWDFANTLNLQEANGGVYRDDNDPKLRRTLGRNLGVTDGTSNHGTHVAGASAAATNNGLGVAGACPECLILPIKIMSEDSLLNGLLRSAEAMRYAADMGASVVNMSFGSRGLAPFANFSAFTQGVLTQGTAAGTLYVSSAGNDGSLQDDFNYPASYDNVFSVGNSNVNDVPVASSNFGIKTGVFAPGNQTSSTFSDNQYQFLNGTSMASPIVAGVAGLLRSQRPTWTPRQIMHQIRSTSDNAILQGLALSARNPFYYGRLNAFRALTFNNPLNEGPNVVPGISNVGFTVSAENGLITGFQPVRLLIAAQNFLSNANDVSITITSLDGRALPVGTSTVNVGNINTMQQRIAEFLVQLQPSAALGAGLRRADFQITYRSGSYINYERISLAYNTPTTVDTPELTAPTSTDFGIAQVPVTRTITIRNNGNVPITLNTTATVFSGANASEFTFFPTPTSLSIPPTGFQTLTVRFVPNTNATGQGNRTATLTISARTVTTDIVTTLQRTVQLTGVSRFVGSLTVTPAAGLAFGTVTIGTTQILTATFANTSPLPVTIRSVNVVTGTTVTSGEYRLLDQLPNVIAQRTSATLRVQFTPSATTGTRPAFLIIETDSDPIRIALNGGGFIGSPPRQPRVLSYGFVGQADFVGGSNIFSRFDQQPLGTINPPRIGEIRIANDIQVRNRGTQAVTVTGASFSGVGAQEFTMTGPIFPFTLQPNQSTTLTVRYAPTVVGEKFTSVTFLIDSAQRSTTQQDILVFGSIGGIPRLLPIAPRTSTDVINGPVRAIQEVNFPLVAVGNNSTQSFVLRNPSTTASVALSGVQFSGQFGNEYTVTAPTQFPVTIAPNATLPLDVRFAPTGLGRRLARITLNYDAEPRSETVILVGNGSTSKRLTENLLFRLINFGPLTTNQVSVTSVTITFANTGSEPIRVTSATLEGEHSGEFRLEALATPTPFTLQPQQTFAVRLLFAPRTLGFKFARFVINSDTDPIAIQLRGTGAAPTPSADLQIDPVNARVGEIVEVPIFLRNRTSFPANTTIYATLSFNNLVAEPVDAALQGVLEDNRRIIPLTLSSGAAGDAIIGRIRLRGKADNFSNTVLSLSGVTSLEGVLVSRNGLFTITDFPAISLPSELTARPGETVTLNVTTQNRRNILPGRVFTASVNFNASLLQPQNAQNAGTVSNGRRTLTFQIPAGTTDSTWQIPLRATLGNDSVTTIAGQMTSPTGSTSLVQGLFRLTGLNQVGGPWRFFSERPGLAIVKTLPNPVSNAASIVYELSNDAEVSMLVNDVNGRTLDEILLGEQKAGTYTAELPLKTLRSGTYLVTLRSSIGTATAVVSVVR
ncbi:MAG: S8 family serine peptidase [Candidatus Kapabacteria bacterium]|jgi:subtilisin family serine protease/P pilus assembly chaperone PapD|nr:S8 family serine peptidase [Candidatus Kapabacteria bacterium]